VIGAAKTAMSTPTGTQVARDMLSAGVPAVETSPSVVASRDLASMFPLVKREPPMNVSTRVKLVALASLSVCILFLGIAAAAQTRAIAGIQPESPLRLSPGAPVGAASSVSKEHLAFTYVIQNVSGEDVVLYAINWIWEDASGTVVKRGDYTYLWSFDPDKPVLRPGETRALTKDLIPRSAVLKAQIDSVLLADGTAYGPDVSQSRQRFRYMLSATRSTQKRILALLESQGPEKAKDLLRRELAREADERRYFSPKLIISKP